MKPHYHYALLVVLGILLLSFDAMNVIGYFYGLFAWMLASRVVGKAAYDDGKDSMCKFMLHLLTVAAPNFDMTKFHDNLVKNRDILAKQLENQD